MPDWFKDWFNSPYYHILYKNRDDKEARRFMDKLFSTLELKNEMQVLDAACGKGRHSLYLHEKGLDVTGIDLSPESIRYASTFENDRLHFYVHDMRRLLCVNCFDVVFNLFTSFGYFKKERDDERAINTFSKALKPGGFLVLDFLNAQKVLKEMREQETKTIEGINFNISKSYEEGFIIKTIAFEAGGKQFSFKERVKALREQDFRKYFEQAGLKILHLYGDYDLHPFNPETADRLIFICRKPYD